MGFELVGRIVLVKVISMCKYWMFVEVYLNKIVCKTMIGISKPRIRPPRLPFIQPPSTQ
jgi:hypothetical protein